MEDDAHEGDQLQPETAPHAQEPAAQPPPVASPFIVPPPGPANVPPAPPSNGRRARNALIVVAIVVAVMAVISHIGRGKVSVADLKAGTCVQLPADGGAFSQAPKRDCAGPHDAEIMGWVDDVETLLPDADGTTEAQKKCEALFTTYTGGTPDPTVYKVGYLVKKGSATNTDALCYTRSATGAPLTRSLQRP